MLGGGLYDTLTAVQQDGGRACSGHRDEYRSSREMIGFYRNCGLTPSN
jgi:hypothetical protein